MKQLNHKAVWLFFLSSILRLLWVLVFVGIWGVLYWSETAEPSNGLNAQLPLVFLKWLWIIVPAFLIVCFVWAKLTYHFYRYELTDSGFRKEEGVIYKKYVTIPYDRIQNVDIYRGILARILGLSDLNIQTAGASAAMGRYGTMGISSEGRLPALSREVAEQLRDELIQRTRQTKNQGL
ncbi:MAG: hypothetical protein A3H60_00245 [Candidatus Zambryskibacteria bacterium RIFCSPLOWO2_02_FULL_44_12b]|uniref:YdbS-like PH domain-containing protein n=1 Tax=Candidatus Zambryskibacteria bacterium RIFCSPLOWO2_02_FULL_44_12b TaxID=1802772 RepID=A0A1G2UM93_9BACT|nr:MAG: hypothetical protein A3H60_00245 [Candidatus Zambryskibacteria bacterium RIFCSPLOWO2_02_FULL_44_12b]